MTDREDLITKLGLNPRLAHDALFAHRHPNTTPAFHGEIIDLWHDQQTKYAIIKAFRGANVLVYMDAFTRESERGEDSR